MIELKFFFKLFSAGRCDDKYIVGYKKHLKLYYKFYYEEMLKAFKVKYDPVKDAPHQAWRYRCDPTPNGTTNISWIEHSNYERFYDFDTVSIFCN